ncbi:MAG: SprT family zinc-dependent metalloprotease [Candidatus Contendobacter sp.]
MATRLQLGDIAVDVVLKDIKNVHLSVYPPLGQVRISAPRRMSLDTIRVFAISKLEWIKRQQRKLWEQERETPREYLDRESHYLWGTRYLLKVVEENAAPTVLLKPGTMILRVRPGISEEKKQAIVAEWYRQQIKLAATELIAKWEPILGVRVGRLFIQRMKTRWGGCNIDLQSIRLNTELAKKPKECLEYIIVHELAHLLERKHGDRFTALMDRHLPTWRTYREELNRAPLGYEQWPY